MYQRRRGGSQSSIRRDRRDQDNRGSVSSHHLVQSRKDAPRINFRNRMGVGKRTVYRHYPDKETLAVAGIRILPTFDGWVRGEGGTRERIKQAVARGKLFPHYLAPVLSTCVVHRDDVPSLLETLNSHVLEPRINAFDEALADARAEGVIKEDIHGFQVDWLVTGLLLAQYRGLLEMNTANKDATLMADTIWKFISK